MTVMNCKCLCVRNKILKSSRHLGFTRKRKVFLSPSYHPNAVTSFQLKRLAGSRGICPNCIGVKEVQVAEMNSLNLSNIEML